jgi:hypothetical protein
VQPASVACAVLAPSESVTTQLREEKSLARMLNEPAESALAETGPPSTVTVEDGCAPRPSIRRSLSESEARVTVIAADAGVARTRPANTAVVTRASLIPTSIASPSATATRED